MAEVEGLTTAEAADIPKVPSVPDVGAAELGTSPAQEPSSNSHPHDSEYDTASDLEGGDDYDDEDDGESISEDDDEEDDDVEEDDNEDGRPNDNDSVLEKTDDSQKKVDEDRSNPQYIPKRGTFYEHDDRTAEDAEGAPIQAVVVAEVKEADGTNPQSPAAISHASKTMKKWQPASAVDRWSHDRFDPGEQAPKSKTELVNAYGYDIRNEDAPPRARRRRRYGRGPSKYSRNWEDETAYLKASNSPRKPLKPSDFPALNERGDHRQHSVKDEKENRVEKQLFAAAVEKNNSSGPPQRSSSNEKRDVHKGNKNKNVGRNQQPTVRQSAMEFRNKQRTNHSQIGSTTHNSQNYRLEQQHHHNDRNINRSQQPETNEAIRKGNKSAPPSKHMYSKPNEHYNSNQGQVYSQTEQAPILPSQNPRAVPKAVPSSLSARLQQVQNRNDPSHVGSVQMHALANQNQMVAGQQQQANMMIAPQQPQQLPVSTSVNHPDQGRPKRYSSIRRSQHDTQNLDQHQMQQLQLQQQIAPQPLILQDQHLLQANLMQLYHQENLQAQMQAMQVSAGQQPCTPNPPTYATVAPPVQQLQPPPLQPYATNALTGSAPATFYVTTADAYTASAATAQVPPAAQYAPQPPPNYMQNTAVSAAPPLNFTSPPPPPQQTVVATNTVPIPTVGPIAYGVPNTVPNGSQPAPNAPVPTAGQPGYQNYNYQNYNTVGGTTYFVPPTQPTSRPVVPQRRPTNAIPILPPSEKNKERNQQDSKEEGVAKNFNNGAASSIGSVENIDHILDNMFVQRPAYQLPAAAQPRKSSLSPSEGIGVDPSNAAGSPPAQSVSQNEETSTEKITNESSESANNVGIAKEVV